MDQILRLSLGRIKPLLNQLHVSMFDLNKPLKENLLQICGVLDIYLEG